MGPSRLVGSSGPIVVLADGSEAVGVLGMIAGTGVSVVTGEGASTDRAFFCGVFSLALGLTKDDRARGAEGPFGVLLGVTGVAELEGVC